MHHTNRFIPMRWGKVVKVRRGEAASGGTAAQWLADLEDVHGSFVKNCRVVGPRAPLEHTRDRPSFCLWGTMETSLLSPWCLPCPWTSTTEEDVHAEHERIDDYSGINFRVLADGTYKVFTPDDDPVELFEIDPTEDDALFKALGGSREMARLSDVVRIDAVTSPTFVAALTQIIAAVNLIPAMATAVDGSSTALEARIAALETWAAGAGAALDPPVPFAAADPLPAPTATPAAAAAVNVAMPADPGGVVDGADAGVGVAIGTIASASPWTRGK